MRILAIDGGYFSLDWYLRCLDDGHEVKVYCPDNPKTALIGKGLVERVSDWRDWIRWCDFCFLPDNVKWMAQLEPWKRAGVPIIGHTTDLADWEIDRGVGMAMFKKHGVDIPPYKTFKNYPDAIAYVKKENRPFASKPIGDCPDKNMSYVAKTPADLVFMLEKWHKAGKRMEFILQELVTGVEMAVGGWIGPGGFSEGWCENWEFKKMMPGDLGMQTGEMGTVLRVVKQSKLADKVLKPFEETLVKMGACGYVDINCIIDDAGNPWPLEFTMRFGWPLYNIQQALIDGDHAEWLAALADGQDLKPWKMDLTAAGVLMAIPDFPFSHISRKEVCGVPVYGLTPKLMENVHPCEMMLGTAPQDQDGKIVTSPCLVTAGDYVLVASGTGGSVRQATTMAYRILKTLKVPNSPMYRTDIGARLKKQLPMIQSRGYATGLEY